MKEWEVLDDPAGLFNSIIRDMIDEEKQLKYGDPSQPNKKVFISKDKWLGIKNSYPEPSDTYQVISASMNWNKPIPEMIQRKFPDMEEHIFKIMTIQSRYETQKRIGNKLDYNDMIYFWNEILDHEAVKKFAMNFKYILIDEYQDTNVIQNEIIQKLSVLPTTQMILAVGDDAQSIYAFRGANFQNILDFQEHFIDAKVYEITVNYRSIPEILDFANDSIGHNKKQYKKEMKPIRKNYHKPIYAKFFSQETQVEFIIQNIKELHSKGIGYKDMAVLCRALKGIREEIQYLGILMMRLREEKIPYVVQGGEDFIDKVHIKDVLAFFNLKYLHQDILADEWLRRITGYVPHFGIQAAQYVYRYVLREEENPFQILINEYYVTHALSQKVDIDKIRRGLENLCRVMTKLNDVKGANIGEEMEHFFFNELEIYYSFETIYKKGDNDQEFENKIKDLFMLFSMAQQYDSFTTFYESIILEKDKILKEKRERMKKLAHKKEEEKDELIISTIHQAKGLEWNTVFIPNLQNGYFPSHHVLPIEEDLEEERRLFYVAVTRAKDHLIMSSALDESLFINELNKGLYTHIEGKNE